MDLKSTYNLIAEDWHRDHQKDSWWVDGTNMFISLLSPGARVLDVGCAGGIKSQYLIERDLRVVGIDLSEKMIEIAKREVPAGEFYAIDMENVSTLHDEFDGVFIQAALLHISKEKVPSVLSGIASKIKLGGFLYIAVKAMRPNGKEEEVVKEDDYGYKYERFFSYFTPDEIKAYFADLGFKVVYESGNDSNKTQWIQVIGRKPELI